MKMRNGVWLAGMIALSAQGATPEAVRELYAEGKFTEVLQQAPSAAAQIQESMEAEQLVQLAEDTAVLRLRRVSGLAAIYSAFAKRSWPSGFTKRLKAAQKLAGEAPPIDTLKDAGALVGAAEKLFAKAKAKMRERPPYPEAEPALVFASAASLRALDAKPTAAQRARALSVLSRALPHVFRGTQRPYQESFLTEFPGDPLAPMILEMLRSEIDEYYRAAGEPSDIPEKEQELLRSFEAKIKAASKPGK